MSVTLSTDLLVLLPHSVYVSRADGGRQIVLVGGGGNALASEFRK